MDDVNDDPDPPLRVLSLSGPLPAAVAQVLETARASVLSVEPPAGDGDSRVASAPRWPPPGHRATIALDLTCGPDRDALLALAAVASLAVEAWRPGFADRLGLGFQHLAAANPALVYLSCGRSNGPGEPADSLTGALATARARRRGVHLVLGEEP